MYNQFQTDFRPSNLSTESVEQRRQSGKWIMFDCDLTIEHVAAMNATLDQQTDSMRFLERESEILLDRPAQRYSVLHPASGPSGMHSWRARHCV